MIFKMTYALKHASPTSMYLRDIMSLCSRYHSDCRHILAITRGQNSIYDSGITVSSYDVNTVH
jgi:hypothetical protein